MLFNLLLLDRVGRWRIVGQAEGETKHRQRQLRVAGWEPFGLLSEQAAFEFLVGLLEEPNEFLVLIALARQLHVGGEQLLLGRRRASDGGFECLDALRENRCGVAHVCA
ncbi:MAG: hypothetical protein ACLP1X_15875 [Polyangiaceae bacterium]